MADLLVYEYSMSSWHIREGTKSLEVYDGENNTRQLRIAVSDYDSLCTYSVDIEAFNGESLKYNLPLTVSEEDDTTYLSLTIPSSIASKGLMIFQIIGIWTDGAVIKSNPVKFSIRGSINADPTSDVPVDELETWKAYLTDVIKSADTLDKSEEYSDAKDAETLETAKSYSDTKDLETLETAKAYSDTKDSETLETAKAYSDKLSSDNALTTGSIIGALGYEPADKLSTVSSIRVENGYVSLYSGSQTSKLVRKVDRETSDTIKTMLGYTPAEFDGTVDSIEVLDDGSFELWAEGTDDYLPIGYIRGTTHTNVAAIFGYESSKAFYKSVGYIYTEEDMTLGLYNSDWELVKSVDSITSDAAKTAMGYTVEYFNENIECVEAIGTYEMAVYPYYKDWESLKSIDIETANEVKTLLGYTVEFFNTSVTTIYVENGLLCLYLLVSDDIFISDAPLPVKDVQTSDGTSVVQDNVAIIPDDKIQDVKSFTGSSFVKDGVATIPLASYSTPGMIRIDQNAGLYSQTGGTETGLTGVLMASCDYDVPKRLSSTTNSLLQVRELDNYVKAALTDGLGAAYSEDEQKAARERLGVIESSDVDEKDTTVLDSAKSYSDSKDSETLEAAKSYSDTKDSETLESAKSYSDSKDSETLESAKTYSNELATQTSQLVNQALGTKIDKPSDTPAVGKVLKIKSVNEDGTFVCEWADDEDSITDVQVAGTSVVTDGVANVPIASTSSLGTVLGTSSYGVSVNSTNGLLSITSANETQISGRTSEYKPIVTTTIDYAVKAALTDGVGAAYTQAQQIAACERLGIMHPLKPWTLVGTIYGTEDDRGNIDDGVSVDLTGCTELLLQVVYTATASSNVYVTIESRNARIASTIISTTSTSNPTRTSFGLWEEKGGWIVPLCERCSAWTTYSDVGTSSSFNSGVILGSVSSITKLYLGTPSAVTICDFRIYGR